MLEEHFYSCFHHWRWNERTAPSQLYSALVADHRIGVVRTQTNIAIALKRIRAFALDFQMVRIRKMRIKNRRATCVGTTQRRMTDLERKRIRMLIDFCQTVQARNRVLNG